MSEFNNAIITIFHQPTENTCCNMLAQQETIMNKLRCAREELLIPAVDAGGLDEIRITQIERDTYILSIKIKTKREWTYLATRRKPGEPRRFRRIEAAVAVGNKLFNAKRFTIALP